MMCWQTLSQFPALSRYLSRYCLMTSIVTSLQPNLLSLRLRKLIYLNIDIIIHWRWFNKTLKCSSHFGYLTPDLTKRKTLQLGLENRYTPCMSENVMPRLILLYFEIFLSTSSSRLHSTKQTPWRLYRTCQRSIPWLITRLPPSSPSSSLTWESSPRRLSAMNSSSFIYNCASPSSIKMHRQNELQGVGFNWILTSFEHSCWIMRRPPSRRVTVLFCVSTSARSLSVSQSPPRWFALSLVSWEGECHLKAPSCLLHPRLNPADTHKTKTELRLNPAHWCSLFNHHISRSLSGNTSLCFLLAAIFLLRTFLVFCFDQDSFLMKFFLGKGVSSLGSASIFCLCFSLFLSL